MSTTTSGANPPYTLESVQQAQVALLDAIDAASSGARASNAARVPRIPAVVPAAAAADGPSLVSPADAFDTATAQQHVSAAVLDRANVDDGHLNGFLRASV